MTGDDEIAAAKRDWVYDNPYLLLALAALFWSGNHFVGRAIGGEVPPVGISTVRWLLPTIALGLFAFPLIRRDWPVIRTHWGKKRNSQGSGEAMRRREFVKCISGALAAWPLVAGAQQAQMPVVGFLSAASPEGGESRAAAFRRGLQETGYVAGQNVTVEYHCGGAT